MCQGNSFSGLCAVVTGACLLLASSLVLAAPATEAGEAKPPPQVLITADELIHDRDLGTVTARGHVEIDYLDRSVVADVIHFNMPRNVVTASGNVSLLETDGSVVFASYAELTGDLKDAFVRDVQVLLADHSRLAGVSAFRIDGVRNEINRGVYSPCAPCKDNPEKAPLWQVKAIRVIHNQIEQQVEYRNAWMEMAGVPIFYTPYLSHPDPSVVRRSGFLPPTWGRSPSLGPLVRTPYFLEISPSTDVTVIPMFTANQGVVLGGEYRGRFATGEVKLDSSATRDQAGQERGHIFGLSRFDINDTWRTGLQVQRASDDTYLQRYKFPVNDPFLTTHGIVEGFGTRSYGALEGYAFQGLRTPNVRTGSPIVMPLAAYNFVGEPSSHGGFFSADANTAIVQRKHDPRSGRISLGGGWTLPYTGSLGDVYELKVGARSDAYYVENGFRAGGESFNGTATRLTPEASVKWRFPLSRIGEDTRQVIEPIVQSIASPRASNPVKIPNVDSRDFEFDDTNLFSHNRFTGFDRVEGGPRVNYGIGYSIFSRDPGGPGASALLGQTYHVWADPILGPGTGLENHQSDYVGRVDVTPYGNLDLLYRFRIHRSDLAVRRNEVAMGVGPKPLRLGANYVLINQGRTEGAEFDQREEVAFTLSSAVSRYWTLGLRSVEDLTRNGGPLNQGILATYEDECLVFTVNFSRDFTYNTDVEAGTSVMMHLIFKTLGQVQSSL
ncbi:MAG: LPS-assembly protein LptD [Alphaproteobacteria bacterium]